ncbi:MAG: orotidine-5'-phosphate decarboxylase [Gammaproteobacteria bacterium]|nr:orotidine-5'-phosphate decarboxylase [Gammaproteobacteria bacterium]
MSIPNEPRIIVALDFPNDKKAFDFVSRIEPGHCRLKVGKELFTSAGPALVEKLVSDGFDVFLDLKFHDIPNTVASACSVASQLGVWMMNVHALGGRRMMSAAREAVEKEQHKPILLAVTILTSMDENDLAEIGIAGKPEDNVMRLANLAKEAGVDGVVCSAQEANKISTALGKEFCLVTPGIRPKGGDVGDQRRIMTPADAIKSGAHYLVVGRPITQSEDPMGVLLTMESEISTI